jgi:tetratricopeptide (TPR) repeat protein
MNESSIVYLSLLIIILLAATFFIIQQIIKTRKVEGSLSRLQKKLKTEKGTSQEYYELGSLFLQKKLFVQAISLFEKSLKDKEIEPENRALIYNAIGYSYFAQEQYDIAIRQYKEALKLNPEYIIALNNLGSVYEKKKLNAQALEIYQESLKYDPENKTAKKRVESLQKRYIPST